MRVLHLCMLGCEDQPPYGPTDHTGTMFLDLITQAAQHENLDMHIKISIYRVQQFDYPESFRDFDGVLLPGSFSAAYDDDSWITQLKDVIRDQLWADRIPSMGVCFGHQIMAHAMEAQGGLAMKCPSGSQAGCRSFRTVEPHHGFGSHRGRDGDTDGDDKPSLDLLYTHGDMVKSLPHVAKSLGGTPQVPILGAVYYSDDQSPLFCTFQAHPEYASQGPKQPTLRAILAKMEERGDVTNHAVYLEHIEKQWDTIYQDSVSVMRTTCRLLKWFPTTY